MFPNINITTKVFSSLIVAILGMLIISISSYIGFSKIGSELEEISEYQVPMNKLITELEASILKEEILTYELFIESNNVNSNKFKGIEKKIKKLEASTDKLIIKAESIVEKAIQHNTDDKTKDIYELFFKELKLLEKEQKSFEKKLSKFENDIKIGDTSHIKKDKELVISELKLMDKNIIKLMHQMEELLDHSTHQAEMHEKLALRIIEIISVIAILISTFMAFALLKLIRRKFASFQNSFVAFFQFLNRESTNVDMADDKYNDEFGQMSKVLNENIHKSKQLIEEERGIINETIEVLSEFEVGDLSKRIKTKSHNPALNELTNLLNQMGDNLKDNIDNILKILDEYGNNNYLNRVKTEGLKEHLFKLSTGINELGEVITTSLQRRKRNALTLQSSANTLKDNVESLSESSNEAAASLEETSAALEEITSTIISNSDNITDMASYAEKVTHSSNDGEKLATDTMQAMSEIDEQVTSINEAITVIDQIAFQTNILSLNAAVEAATAGEAGKGFAVVAGEVRNLASRSAEAAREIKDIVESAAIKAGKGKGIAQNMLNCYENLNTDIEKTLELINNVDSASKEQQLGIEQINDAVSQLDQQTQKNSAAAMETNDIAIGTEKLSETMLTSINSNEFKGKDDVFDRRSNCRDLDYKGSERRRAEKTIKGSRNIQSKDEKQTRTSVFKGNKNEVKKEVQVIKDNSSNDEWESF